MLCYDLPSSSVLAGVRFIFENNLLIECALKLLEVTINNIDIKSKIPIKIKNNKENI
jgi:hypothetical protein